MWMESESGLGEAVRARCDVRLLSKVLESCSKGAGESKYRYRVILSPTGCNAALQQLAFSRSALGAPLVLNKVYRLEQRNGYRGCERDPARYTLAQNQTTSHVQTKLEG